MNDDRIREIAQAVCDLRAPSPLQLRDEVVRIIKLTLHEETRCLSADATILRGLVLRMARGPRKFLMRDSRAYLGAWKFPRGRGAL